MMFLVIWLMETGLSFMATVMGLSKLNNHIYDLVDIFSIFPFLGGLCLFELFLNLDMGRNSVINNVAKHTLCVYLFHENPLFRYWIWDKVFRVDGFYYQNVGIYLIHMFAVTIILFLIGFILDVIISKLWRLINSIFCDKIFVVDSLMMQIELEDKHV